MLQTLPEKSIHTCVTSPPYFGLRDYGLPKTLWTTAEYSPMAGLQTIELGEWEGCLGLEPTPDLYIGHLVQVFREVWRVLRDDGTCWVNMGDSYNGSGGAGGDYNKGGLKEGQPKYKGRNISTLKPKDLMMIPARLALALQADGWYLRSDIIWNKSNPIPESVTDRPTKSHEYIFLLAKNKKYFYDVDAIREPYTSDIEQPRDKHAEGYQADYINGQRFSAGEHNYYSKGGRNKRSVWNVSTQPFPDAHFATFPSKLITPCVLAGTSAEGCCSKCGAPYKRVTKKGKPILNAWSANGAAQYNIDAQKMKRTGLSEGSTLKHIVPIKTIGWQPTCKCNADIVPCTVLDIFNGSGTVGIACVNNELDYIGIELSEKYVEMSRKRIDEAKGKADTDLYRILLLAEKELTK